MKRFIWPLMLVACLLAVSSASSQPVGERLLADYIAHYDGKRASSMAFSQQTVLHRQAQVDTLKWFEVADGDNLRINFAPLESNNGMMFTGGERIDFRNGAVVSRREEVNMLQVLFITLFSDPLESSLDVLRAHDFDLDQSHDMNVDGNAIVVIGTDTHDMSKPQFWFDTDHQRITRVVELAGPQKNVVVDVRVEDWQEIGGAQYETAILAYVNGNLAQEETYSNLQVGIDVPANMFSVDDLATTSSFWADEY